MIGDQKTWNEVRGHHKILFESTNALKLGKIHCKILLADNLYEKKSRVQKEESPKEFDFTPIELTSFGKETAGNFIKWWVRKHVDNLGEIKTKIEEIIPSLTKLKRASLRLNERSNAKNYEDLIVELRDFVEQNAKEIKDFYNFVLWLNELDEFSPCVLFTHPPWSTTQLSDRYFKVDKECDEIQSQRATEVVLGLWSRGPTLAMVRNEMESDWAQSVDPEYSGPSPITYKTAFSRASKKILNEFALYFQKMRDSVEMIQSEFISFTKGEILNNEVFLKMFILKALPRHRLECDLWDFKQTIPAWHSIKSDRLKSDFACNVASFANSKGGLIIIGIDNNRKVVGVDKIETRIRQSRSILEKYIEKPCEFIDIINLPIKSNDEKIVNCIVIKIPQTKEVVGVKEVSIGRGYLFPVRISDGIDYRSHKEVAEMKKDILEDNFIFARDILDFVYYN